MDSEQLITRCLAGDEEAWHSFVHRYAPRVQGAVVELRRAIPDRKAGNIDPGELTEDVFQALIEDDFRRLRSAGPPYDLEPWLLLVARRLLLKRLRLSPDRASGIHEESPERNLVRDELSDLPPSEQVIIFCFFFEGVGYRALAEHSQMPTGQVARILSDAFNRIIRRLQGPGQRG